MLSLMFHWITGTPVPLMNMGLEHAGKLMCLSVAVITWKVGHRNGKVQIDIGGFLVTSHVDCMIHQMCDP